MRNNFHYAERKQIHEPAVVAIDVAALVSEISEIQEIDVNSHISIHLCYTVSIQIRIH